MIKSKKRIIVPRCSECESFEKSMFCSLHFGDEKLLSDNKIYNQYHKGQIIFHEGYQPQGLFCIYSGKVKIHKMGADGREQIVRFATQSNIIGYRSLLSGEKYFASATAIEDTVVCYFPKNVFTEIISKSQPLALETIKLLARDLRTAEKMILDMAQKKVQERIAAALLMLKKCYGTDESTETINTTLTREEISNIVGTSTETCIRILSELNRRRVIKLIGKRIKIINLSMLMKIANLNE